MPDRSTKHIARPQEPVGTVKDGKVKVFDGESQSIKWRQGRTGMSRDWDGDPVSRNYNVKDLKKRPHHQAHTGSKRKSHQPRMGNTPSSQEE